MNSLFTCSWQINVSPINEQTWVDDVSTILTEAAEEQTEIDLGDETTKSPGKRGKKADPRYARLMGLGSVRELAGTMTPRYFATKVIRQLEADYPDKKIEDITDEELLQAMNLISNLSRKLVMKPEIKFSAQKTEDIPKAKDKVKKGKDAFETLAMNLDAGVELKFKEDTPSGLGVYTAEKDGLNYRIALREFDGKPIKVKDITKDNIASLVVTEPSSKQTIEAPTVGDIEAPKIERDKPVVDYPAEGDGDFSGPDPEDLATGKDYEMDEDEDEEDMDDDQDMTDDEDPDDELDMSDDVDTDELDMSDEDCEGMNVPMKPTIIIIKRSPQSLHREMMQNIIQDKQNRMRHERRNTLGY